MTSELTPEQQSVRDEFNWFARSVLRSYSSQADRLGGVPQELLGLPVIANSMRIHVPIRFGGGWQSIKTSGRTYDLVANSVLRVVAMEEIGYGDTSLFIALPWPTMAAPVVEAFASPELQRRFFASFVDGSGPRWASFAMTEPKVGSDATAISTTATRDGDAWILNGTKWFIGSGALASWVVVFATSNVRLRRYGIHAFMVERGTPGFIVGRRLPTSGFRALTLSELKFENCRVPAEHQLTAGRPGAGGFDASMRTFDQFRPSVGAWAVGASRAAIEYAREILLQNGARHAYARSWNRVQARLDDLAQSVHAARLLNWKAAWLLDQGIGATEEISVAKAFCAEVATEVCSACLDLAGRAAMAGAAPLEKLVRDMKAFDHLEGTGDIHRLMITRSMLRNSPMNREGDFIR